MPTWRCPHCGTPQAEASRCWVCRRSSTACATCRHFRHSVVGQLGYCGLDRGRSPLAGNEIRPCWNARTDLVANAVAVGAGAGGAAGASAGRAAGARSPMPVATAAERPFGKPTPIALTDTAGRLWVDTD